MSYGIARRYRDQFEFLRRQFLQDGETTLGNIGSETLVAQALALVGGWKQRIYTPLVTLWVFLEQVTSADHSCRAAVARLITRRIAGGRNPCSSQTGAYCQARKRLPEVILPTHEPDSPRPLKKSPYWANDAR